MLMRRILVAEFFKHVGDMRVPDWVVGRILCRPTQQPQHVQLIITAGEHRRVLRTLVRVEALDSDLSYAFFHIFVRSASASIPLRCQHLRLAPKDGGEGTCSDWSKRVISKRLKHTRRIRIGNLALHFLEAVL